MVSGGICSFEGCSKRLIENTNGSLTNIGIKAHIIGHAKNSARHQYMEEYGYTQATLEDVSNLMLMCYYHSKLIDDERTRDQFPPDRLFQMKKNHEEWVSSWSAAEKKKSVALIYKKLGNPITEIRYDGEIPYLLVEALEDQIEFVDSSTEGWNNAKRNNEELLDDFMELVRERDVDVAEVFPLSPIPLLIHMGFLLTDTISLCVYQFDRENEVWVMNKPEETKNEEIKVEQESKINGVEDLAVLVSISGKVKVKDVEEAISNNFDYLSFTINNPGVKRVLYRNDVKSIQSIVKEQVESLIQDLDYERIHLFLAGPAGLALEIGRGINPRIWGEVRLYQFDRRVKPRYQYAFSLN